MFTKILTEISSSADSKEAFPYIFLILKTSERFRGFFLATLSACRSSQAKDRTCATAVKHQIRNDHGMPQNILNDYIIFTINFFFPVLAIHAVYGSSQVRDRI